MMSPLAVSLLRSAFRNPHSHLRNISPGGPCPPIDMLCKARQLGAHRRPSFEIICKKGSQVRKMSVIHANILPVVISDIPISCGSFVTSSDRGPHWRLLLTPTGSLPAEMTWSTTSLSCPPPCPTTSPTLSLPLNLFVIPRKYYFNIRVGTTIGSPH